ncbi:MAG: hypothetical protein HY842_09075, partial [Bacteroidetes bacterium]|nr:hypothetical protein [Bacteroidota bacterium]
CVPVPLTNLPAFDMFLDGTQFSNPFSCDYEPTTAYSYTFLPGVGFSGPYSLDSWVVNANSYNGFFNNANELLLLMNTFDPAGNWQINLQTGLIFGGDPNSNYANMQVSHLPSGTTTMLNPNTNFLPTGFTVGLSNPGLHSLVVENPFSGCGDTLYINVVLDPILTDTVFLTASVNTPTGAYCLDGSDLPGGTIVNVGYCGGPSNGVAPLASPTCVYYEPALNYAGPDEFCMIVCDGGFLQICDTTIFIINVLPQTDTVNLTIPGGVASLDTCFSNFVIELPGPVTSASFCSINQAQITGNAAANCLILNTNGTFFGTTEVCVAYCSGSVCDQVIVIVTIEEPAICGEIFDQNSITVTSQADSNFLCIPIPPGQINDYDVTVDGNLYSQSFMPCDFGNIAVYSYTNLPAGSYFVESWTANGINHSGNVPDFDALLDSLNAWDPNGDWVNSTTTLTIQGGQGGTYSNLVVTPVGSAPQTLSLNLVQTAFGSQVTISGFGSHEIIVTAANGCADTVTFILEQHLVTTEIFYFNTTVNNSVNAICGNTFELVGNLFSVSFCGLPANGFFGVVTPVCFSYTPNLDFVGSDTACIVLCDDSPLPVCDTFIFVINVADVLPPCPDIFPQDEVFVSLQNGTGEVCLPVPVTQINDYQIFIDGVLYNNSLSVCDFDSVYIYFYGLVFGQGNSGPYSASWQAYGSTFTGVVQNMTELLALMNGWDAAGNWQMDASTLILASSNDGGVYGNLTLTHLGTGVVSQLAPDFNAVPLGTAVQVSGAGQQEILLVSTVDGCADTLVVTGLEGVDILDILTVEDVPSDVECIDISGLPGSFNQLFVCQAPLNGSLLISGNCFTFNPAPGFIGTNTGCVVACDNLGNCDTTLLNITVDPLCSLFDVFPDDPQQLQVIDCADISAYCVDLLLDSIGQYGVLDNGMPYTG